MSTSKATVTLPIDKVVQVVKVNNPFGGSGTVRHSRCRICNERFTHYGDDPADLTAEIVARQHVIPEHEGVLHESTTD